MLFAHIQYPIIDLRPFMNDEYKREQPSFPAPNVNSWLRNFGHVRERRTDTSPYYIAENFFCEAHNAIKFEKLPLFIKDEGAIFIEEDEDKSLYEYEDWMDYRQFDKVCRFRRFRSDGYLKSCFEIGIDYNPIYDDSILFSHQELKEIIVNVKSYSEKGRIRIPLFDLGNHICKLYEDSTSIKKTPVKTVYSGKPFIVYIDHERYSNYNKDNNIIFHREFRKMGFDLMHYKGNNENFWIINPWKYHYNKKLLASIRRALLAISLEKETLLSAYDFLLVNAGKGYIDENKVLNYIKHTQEKLLRQVRFGIPQNSIVDVLFKLDFNNNKAFYYDIINLISKVGDRYVVNDFNKLFIELDFKEWREKIIELLNATNDKDLRVKLKQLYKICLKEDREEFWAFSKIETIVLSILANLLTELL